MQYQQSERLIKGAYPVARDKAQKVDIIKSIIRSHEYTNTLRIYNECTARGLSVSFNALAQFARRLELHDNPALDTAANSIPSIQEILDSSVDPAQKVRYLFALKEEKNKSQKRQSEPKSTGSAAVTQVPANLTPATAKAHSPSAPGEEELTLQQARQKEQALIMELGDLRVQEHQLLKEISLIRKTIKTLS